MWNESTHEVSESAGTLQPLQLEFEHTCLSFKAMRVSHGSRQPDRDATRKKNRNQLEGNQITLPKGAFTGERLKCHSAARAEVFCDESSSLSALM